MIPLYARPNQWTVLDNAEGIVKVTMKGVMLCYRGSRVLVTGHYTPPGRDLYCSPCRLYEPTYRSSPHIPLEEVMWKAEEEVYSDNLLRRRRLSE